MIPPKNAPDDAVDLAFHAMRARVVDAVSTPPATEIVTRGRRRRTTRTALAGAAVAAVLTAGLVLSRGPQPQPDPNTPSPSATWVAPTGSRTPAKPQIPSGFLLHDNAKYGHPGQLDGPARCYGQPAMSGSSSRTVGEQADQVNISQELRVYPDVHAAEQVYMQLRADLQGCLGFPDATVLDPPTDRHWGDEAVTGSVALPADGANGHTSAPVRMVVVRVGTAVATFSGYPQTPDIDNDARAIIGRLCLYNPECHPQTGLPQPLRELREGGHAWAAVIDEFTTDDTTATPGTAMAAAAELGYHPAIVPADCDGGTPHHSTVTIYLTNHADAERLAAALPALPVQIRDVTTHCVTP
jgi:hypothetical protein